MLDKIPPKIYFKIGIQEWEITFFLLFWSINLITIAFDAYIVRRIEFSTRTICF